MADPQVRCSSVTCQRRPVVPRVTDGGSAARSCRLHAVCTARPRRCRRNGGDRGPSCPTLTPTGLRAGDRPTPAADSGSLNGERIASCRPVISPRPDRTAVADPRAAGLRTPPRPAHFDNWHCHAVVAQGRTHVRARSGGWVVRRASAAPGWARTPPWSALEVARARPARAAARSRTIRAAAGTRAPAPVRAASCGPSSGHDYDHDRSAFDELAAFLTDMPRSRRKADASHPVEELKSCPSSGLLLELTRARVSSTSRGHRVSGEVLRLAEDATTSLALPSRVTMSATGVPRLGGRHAALLGGDTACHVGRPTAAGAVQTTQTNRLVVFVAPCWPRDAHRGVPTLGRLHQASPGRVPLFLISEVHPTTRQRTVALAAIAAELSVAGQSRYRAHGVP